MTVLHDRTTSYTPWLAMPTALRSVGIPDNVVEEGGFYWWLEGSPPDLHIMCAGGGRGPFEVQDENAEYPDEIHARRAAMIEKYERNMQ